MIKKRLKAELSKLRFALGLNPQISGNPADRAKYIPTPYKAVCLISADFEMAWASRFSKSRTDHLRLAKRDGDLTRRNLPLILDLCDRYNIPITWATVGHLFLESCTAEKGIKHPDLPRLPYFENTFWKYQDGDWFDADPATDVERDNAWYAPDLIREIVRRPAGHEIGCHSFSHIDCSDSICPDAVFDAEIAKCQAVATPFGIKPVSFVHPGHTIGHLSNLARLGFRNFRSDRGDALCFPILHPQGIWEFRNTVHLEQREQWSTDYHIKRYKTVIDRAIKSGTVCNIWFHPQIGNEQFVRTVFQAVLEHLDRRKAEIASLTMQDYCRFLDAQHHDMGGKA